MAGALPNCVEGSLTPLRIRIDIPLTKGEVLRFALAPFKAWPNCLVIGASKAGTTSLFTYLTKLPWVTGPPYKEVHFFSYRWHRGSWFYRSRFPLGLRARLAARGARTTPILLEASPSYLFYPYVAARVAELLPRVKLLVILRNPVERAYSAYQHARYWGWEPLSFEEALDREEERLAASGQPTEQADCEELLYSAAYHSYVQRGLYAAQLERWFQAFPREQLKVLTTERLRCEPAVVMDEVCEFLETRNLPGQEYSRHNYERGVNPYPPMRPETRARLVETFRPRNAELYLLLGQRFDWDC